VKPGNASWEIRAEQSIGGPHSRPAHLRKVSAGGWGQGQCSAAPSRLYLLNVHKTPPAFKANHWRFREGGLTFAYGKTKRRSKGLEITGREVGWWMV